MQNQMSQDETMQEETLKKEFLNEFFAGGRCCERRHCKGILGDIAGRVVTEKDVMGGSKAGQDITVEILPGRFAGEILQGGLRREILWRGNFRRHYGGDIAEGENIWGIFTWKFLQGETLWESH